MSCLWAVFSWRKKWEMIGIMSFTAQKNEDPKSKKETIKKNIVLIFQTCIRVDTNFDLYVFDKPNGSIWCFFTPSRNLFFKYSSVYFHLRFCSMNTLSSI